MLGLHGLCLSGALLALGKIASAIWCMPGMWRLMMTVLAFIFVSVAFQTFVVCFRDWLLFDFMCSDLTMEFWDLCAADLQLAFWHLSLVGDCCLHLHRRRKLDWVRGSWPKDARQDVWRRLRPFGAERCLCSGAAGSWVVCVACLFSLICSECGELQCTAFAHQVPGRWYHVLQFDCKRINSFCLPHYLQERKNLNWEKKHNKEQIFSTLFKKNSILVLFRRKPLR